MIYFVIQNFTADDEILKLAGAASLEGGAFALENKRVSANVNANVIPIRLDATFFYERAVRSLDRYRYEKALRYFRKAVEFENDNPVNHCNLAGVLSEMGKFEESNQVLREIVERIDPTMVECYYYMANNYANMERFELSEEALLRYLENDPNGIFLEESEEMMDYLSIELERPFAPAKIKAKEELFEHDRARQLLEEGKFAEATKALEQLVRKHPDFMAARNNMALAYYYMGRFDKSVATIREVLELEPGNLHALCNLAIFYQYVGQGAEVQELIDTLRKTYPMHPDHIFKLATTMGILGDHEHAYTMFRRMLKFGEGGSDPSLHHYAAVAAFNLERMGEAKRYWQQVAKLEPGSAIASFYLGHLQEVENGGATRKLNYHYHLPFEAQLRAMSYKEQQAMTSLPESLKQDPLVRSSFFWALRHGDKQTKLQVIQAFGLIGDEDVQVALRTFVAEPEEDDYLKRAALFVLRSIGVREPISVYLDGKKHTVKESFLHPDLPAWQSDWQAVIEQAHRRMHKRYDLIQQHDLETLWVEYLTRVYPHVPRIASVGGWAAALEYLVAKMHRRAVSFSEVANLYQTSVSTVSKNVKLIDKACGLKEKMAALLPKHWI